MVDCPAMQDQSFVLCDASSSKLPILHASSGFEKMYGHSEKSFAALIEVGRPASLYEAVAGELGASEIDDGMDFLESEVKNYAGSVEPMDPLLFINQKSCGEWFTCEMQLAQKHHPALGWSYVVAMHRDVTSALPVSEVLKAAQCASSYRMLCAQWAQRQKNGAQSLLNSDEEFHQIVHGAWRDKISKKLVDENSCSKLQPRSAEVETLASVSTACSMSSLVRKTDGNRTEDPSKMQRSATWSAGQPCFHLGALASSTTDEMKRTESTERSDSEDRDRNLFLDLEEPDCTEELPEAICCSPLSSLPFSFFLLNPRHEELPIVLASHKFACDTMMDDCLLKRFDALFLNAKSATLSPDDLTAFWAASRKGQFLEVCTGGTSFGEVQVEADLQNKSGELMPCIITLKQVELDDEYYVAGVSTSLGTGAQQNDINLDTAIQVMASEFFFSAPMRRQSATDH